MIAVNRQRQAQTQLMGLPTEHLQLHGAGQRNIVMEKPF
jgi:hypothetical protein